MKLKVRLITSYILLITVLMNMLTLLGGYVYAAEVISIGTPEELQQAAIDALKESTEGKNYILTADIDFSNYSFVWDNGKTAVPFGIDSNPFKGTFDGNGHTIKGFKVVTKPGDIATSGGFFGTVGDGAVIKNLGLIDTDVKLKKDYRATGALIGTAMGNVTIENTFIRNTTYSNSPEDWAGGFICIVKDANATLNNCYIVGTSENITTFQLRGEFFAWGSGTNTVTMNNCYTDSNQFAPKPNSSIAYNLTNCYANSEGTYKAWNNYNTNEWIGTKVTAEQLKGIYGDLGAEFSKDVTGTLNNGYPVLNFEIGEKMRGGNASIVSSSIENNSEDISPLNIEVTVEFDRYLKKEYIDELKITVSPSVEYSIGEISGAYTDKINITIPEADISTKYTVSFSADIETLYGDYVNNGQKISFTTGSSYPEFVITKTSPADNEKGVNTVLNAIIAEFSANIIFKEEIKKLIHISPAIDFDVESGGKNIILIRPREYLKSNTTYQISIDGGIESVYGSILSATEFSFQTAKGFENIIPKGNFEDNDSISYFNDANSGTNISVLKDTSLYGKENKVLRMSPAWSDQPVLVYPDLDAGTTYYMSAWIKSDSEQEVALTFYMEGDKWNTKKVKLKSGEWTFVGFDFIVKNGEKVVNVSIRPQSVSGILVDEWSIYDTSYAPKDELFIKKSDISKGETGVSTINLTSEIEFTAPVKLGSVKDGITTKPVNKVKDVIFDANYMNKLKIVFDRLDTGVEYTVDFSGVKGMDGNKTVNDSIKFTTITAASKNADVVDTYPANNQSGVKKGNLELKISFDQPINPDTLGGIYTQPDLNAKSYIKDNDFYNVYVSVDADKIERGTTYRVFVPSSVKTLNNYAANEYNFSFTTITDDKLINTVTSASGNATTMGQAVEEIYTELDHSIKAYDYICENLSGKKTELYNELSVCDAPESVSELMDLINGKALKIILDNVSDLNEIDAVIGDEYGVFNSDIRKIYIDMLGDENRSEIATLAMASKEEEYDNFKEILSVKVMTSALQVKSGAGSVKEILTLSQSIFTGENDISALLDKINNCGNPETVYAKLQKTTATTTKEIKALLQNAYDSYVLSINQRPTTSGGGGNGSSNGGGGGGSGLGVRLPVPDTNMVNSSVFEDVSGDFWAKESIEKLYKMNVISGVGNGKFMPENPVTRAEFIKIAVMALGIYDENAICSFDDLSKDDWCYPYVASAYNKKIIYGSADNCFRGNDLITREDMAVILYRLAQDSMINISDTNGFADENEVSDYALDAVRKLSALKIVNGIGDNKFDPKSYATRAQTVVIFDRFMVYLGK